MPKKILGAAIIILLSAAGGVAVMGQEEMIRPSSLGLYGNASLLFQAPTPLLNPDRDKQNVYPFYQYLDLSANYPGHNVYFNTYMRGREVIDGDQNSFDVYNAFVDISNTPDTYEIRIGRQSMTEGINYILMDGALAKIKPIKGLEITAYGGYQASDIQPQPERPTNNFGVFGIKLKTDAIFGSIISVGYELYDPQDYSSRQFINFAFNRAVPFTDFADVYALGEIDVKQGNLGQLTTGVGITVLRSLYLNLEYDNYNLDQQRDKFRLDPIFDLFSVGRLQQAKVGVTFIPTSFLQIKGSYAYSHYDYSQAQGTNGTIDFSQAQSRNGNIAKLGFMFNLWQKIGLRAFQGFYYINGNSNNDYAFGLNTSIYEEIRKGWQLEFAFAYAYYNKITNQSGNAFSYIVGNEYMLTKDLVMRTAVEFNTNPDFPKDFRVDLGLSYFFSTSM
ncbi:MAG: hypothetical protein ACHQ6U_09050 [Thermodesulfobacteriota bacterium]